MKKLLAVLLVVIATSINAQEKVLLRLNYKKGDKYALSMKMKQDMGAALMDMKMDMEIDVDEEANETYLTRTKYTYLSMVVLQGATEKVNYNSNMKEEELSAEAKKFKSQMQPLLETLIFTEVTKLGENKIVKISPDTPGIDKLVNQSNKTVVYPKEKVGVGSEWKNTQENQGMSMETTYKVIKITKDKIIADVTGKLSMMPSAEITGSLEIDRATGAPSKTVINMEMDMMGNKIKSNVEGIFRKM
ncbi:hypothetical protein WH52_05460 [Tenacibaculum holothuriorum]|uniref:DUF4412 domain-containing protein n=1 Tax=Tenacibaculum holothuriorum TaxID=1635173 RepID=A0A1Y2PET8_9FLAO|nr:hypothetical protein [Tenacibaculum holothuriorum]OSY88229.1 hypothetical protein WH52_05460 [Tenacibaculum holothuriorum]